MSNTQYLRRGHVQFDGWNFTSRLVDLPTIIESHKSIDSKTFYKTADLCQMLICKEGEGWNDDEDESSPMKKKKDPNKVDRKYLWPHGIGPPLKNCRKRRFRKTLKKKYVEAPEIEKEVKRLLRVDNDAVSVKWEVITEEELNANKGGEAGQTDNPAVKPSASGGFTNDPSDLGLEMTDSEDEGGDVDIDSEDNSRLSAGDDSRMSDSMSNTQVRLHNHNFNICRIDQFYINPTLPGKEGGARSGWSDPVQQGNVSARSNFVTCPLLQELEARSAAGENVDVNNTIENGDCKGWL